MVDRRADPNPGDGIDAQGLDGKVDPDTHQVVLTVEGRNEPYTYCDMTGAGLQLVINPPD